MNGVRIFLKKEIKEIKYSKRLVISLLYGALFCVLMNTVANMPGSTPMFNFEISRGLISINLLIIDFGGGGSAVDSYFVDAVGTNCPP